MRKNIILTFLALSLLLGATALSAQSSVLDVEAGYRWLSLDGNEDMYKTQINEQDGLILRSLSYVTDEHAGVLDHFRIEASDLGTSPAGAFRIEASKGDLYRLRLGYRTADHFSALPNYANPLLASGVTPGQHTIDRTRQMLDVDFEFLLAGKITPFVGYSWNNLDGPGTTTYALGGDEFRLNNDLKETDNEFRVGFGYNFGAIYGNFTQGWRDFSGSNHLTLTEGAGTGNSSGTVLGRPVTASSISRDEKLDGSTPFTNFNITGQFDRVRLIGDYVTMKAKTDGSENELDGGSFVSFPLSRFFEGLNESTAFSAEGKQSRAGLRAEVSIINGVDAVAGYEQRKRDSSGTALINSLFESTLSLGGVDPRDITEIINAESKMERTEDAWNVGLVARRVGNFGFRAMFTDTKQDVTVTPDLEEISVPGPEQGGDYSRDIQSYDLGANWAHAGFMVAASYRNDSADEPVLRTDFLDRDRYRVRATWTGPKDFVRIGLTTDRTNSSNDRDGFGYDATIENYGGDLEIVPLSMLRIRGSYNQFKSDSTMLIRRPENFETDTSVYAEKGDAIEGGISLVFKPVTFDVDLGNFENEGNYPYKIDRARARLTFDVTKNFGVAGEYAKDKYDDTNLALANYNAERYGLYLRWHP